jgi:hypothetical protein
MILTSKDVVERYGFSYSSLNNYRETIEAADGIIPGDGKGSSRNLYKSSVLDDLARTGKLGTTPKRNILNIDEQRAKDTV